jgi:hypothetical protein
MMATGVTAWEVCCRRAETAASCLVGDVYATVNFGCYTMVAGEIRV